MADPKKPNPKDYKDGTGNEAYVYDMYAYNKKMQKNYSTAAMDTKSKTVDGSKKDWTAGTSGKGAWVPTPGHPGWGYYKSGNAKDAAKRAAAAKVAKMKKNPANYTQKGVYGFDGMQGQTGPESKLKGK